MGFTLTIEVNDYPDAKYILGAASLQQSINEWGQIENTSAVVPVAAVLTRTAILASIWLTEAAAKDSDVLIDDVLNYNEEMSLDAWHTAFLNCRRAEKVFLDLVNGNKHWRERYEKLRESLPE